MQLAQAIVEATPDAVLAVDTEGRILLWNAGAERIFGYTQQDALGATLDLIVPEKQREAHWTGFNAALAAGTTRYGSDLLAVPAMRKDGTRVSIEMTVALLRNEDGSPAGVAAVVRDVTERRNADRELRAKLAELQSRSA
jgi:PAS domain S-box-containing protein